MAFLAPLAGIASRLALSGAALFASLGFFKSSGPAPQKNGLSAMEIGMLGIYAFGLYLTYKLIREVVR